MHRFIFKRLFYGLLVMFGVITVVFILFNILPGDPARMMLGQRADISSIEAINKDLGRNRPLPVQYLNYLNDLSPVSFHNTNNSSDYWYLDTTKYSYIKILNVSIKSTVILKFPYLHRSYQSKRKVGEILLEAFPNTAILAFASIIFAVVFGIIIGVLCAVKKNSYFDKLSLVFSSMGMSLPSFFTAILAAWIFAYLLGKFTGLNMFGSLYSIDDFGDGEYLSLKNLILPAITLGIRPLTVIVDLTRNSLIEVLNQDFIRTAKAKGLSYYKTITRHALKNAMNPVMTAISGWLASLLAGAVFIEFIFDWKGIGVVIVEALEKYDFPVIMGAVLFVSLILVVINIIVDILYGYLDPRIRVQ